jgi:hypothetical protein
VGEAIMQEARGTGETREIREITKKKPEAIRAQSVEYLVVQAAGKVNQMQAWSPVFCSGRCSGNGRWWVEGRAQWRE